MGNCLFCLCLSHHKTSLSVCLSVSKGVISWGIHFQIKEPVKRAKWKMICMIWYYHKLCMIWLSSKSFCSCFSVIVHMCVSGVIQIKTFSWNSVNEEKTYSYFTSNSRPNNMINLVLHYCVCDIDPFRVEKWRQLELIRFCGQNNLVCNDSTSINVTLTTFSLVWYFTSK